MRHLLINFCVLISLSFLFGSCSNYKELQCTGVTGFKVNKITTEGIDAEVELGIKNPNALGFTIYKSEFDIVYSGVKLGRAKLLKRVHIKGHQERSYAFALRNDFKDVNLLDVMKLLSGATFKNTIEVKGDLYVGKFYLKKKIPIDVKEKVGLN